MLCLKFIWILLSKSPSLWADWHWNTHLNGQSFWNITASASDSWTWRKLLDLRPLALRFIKTRLGNGLDTSFWYDVWTPFGQLSTLMGPAGPRSLRVRKEALVADVTTGSTWSLPHPRSEQEVELHAYLSTITLPLPVDVLDKYEWVASDLSLRTFRSSTTWEVLRPREERKNWIDVVWFKGAIPKLSFTMWIANYDRLPTRSRLASWGMQVSPACPFCSSHNETRDHLLLACQFSQDVWREVLRRCQSPTAVLTNWSELLSWIRSAYSSRLILLRKLATHSVIYHLWKQRNNLVHNQNSLTATSVFRGIDKELKNIISARRLRKKFSSLMSMWLS